MSGEYNKLVVYQNPMSPPSMYVVMVCNYLKIDYKNYEINAMRNEHKKPWYLNINPNGAVPALKDVNGFTTNEGVAMTRYIIESREVDTALYPYNNNKEIAKINNAIEFIIEEVRNFVLTCEQVVFMNPTFFGAERQSKEINEALIGSVHVGYRKLEKLIERNGGDYILGSQLTLADFYTTVWCILPVDTGILTLDDHPTLSKWFDNMMEISEVATVRAKYKKMIKMGLFMVKWILPVIKCCTCQCCCPKKKPKEIKKKEMKFTYFDAYGRGESLRLLLDHAKIKYKDVRIGFNEWPMIKFDTSRFEYAQMPTLEEDGVILSQSMSIMRYLGREYGYYPSDSETAYWVDNLLDLFIDFRLPILKMVLTSNVKLREETMLDLLAKKHFETNFVLFEKKLKENSSQKFFVGNSITIADFFALSLYATYIYNGKIWERVYKILEDYPILKKYFETRWDAQKSYFENRPDAPF